MHVINVRMTVEDMERPTGVKQRALASGFTLGPWWCEVS
jgi:hypothetical protein